MKRGHATVDVLQCVLLQSGVYHFLGTSPLSELPAVWGDDHAMTEVIVASPIAAHGVNADDVDVIVVGPREVGGPPMFVGAKQRRRAHYDLRSF